MLLIRMKQESYLGSPARPLTVIDGFYHGCIVPIVDHVIRAVMDLDLDGVPPIVHEEYDRLLPVTHHGRHVLGCHLSAIAHP